MSAGSVSSTAARSGRSGSEKKFGISRSYVSRIEKRPLMKLYHEHSCRMQNIGFDRQRAPLYDENAMLPRIQSQQEALSL